MVLMLQNVTGDFLFVGGGGRKYKFFTITTSELKDKIEPLFPSIRRIYLCGIVRIVRVIAEDLCLES